MTKNDTITIYSFSYIFFTAKVLLTTGFPKDKGVHSEVFHLSNDKKNCNTLSNFPAPIELAFGGLIKNKFPLICGGFNFDFGRQSSCYILGNNNVVTALMQPRSAGAR